MTHKYCTYCKDYHKVSEFTSHPTGHLGLKPRCKRALYWIRLEERAMVNGASSIDDVIALSQRIKEEPSIIPEVKRVLTREDWDLLTWREYEVLSLRYEGWTLKKIGKKLGFSRERIRQIEKEAKHTLSPDGRNEIEFQRFLARQTHSSHYKHRNPEDNDHYGLLRSASHIATISFVRHFMNEYTPTNDLIFEPILEILIERTKKATIYKDEWFGICEELVAFMK